MIINRVGIFFLFLIQSPQFLFAQSLGNERPTTKWQKISNPYVDVIFEPQSIRIATRTANLIRKLAERDSSFIGGPAQKVPIILHGNSTLPAGVPFLAPWKSDWTITAPQDPFMGSVLWIDLLSIHEYRHHQQMQRAKKGWLATSSRVIAGQLGWFLNVLLVQPTWFFEGDATYTETILTNGGRGRMPKFNMEYHAMRLSGMHYNYEKASRGSRKDFVPNIYRKGYYLTSFARKQFGADIWTKVLDDTYHKKGFFYPFTRSLRKFTGMRTPELYEATMKDLDSLWTIQDQQIQVNKSNKITGNKKVFTNYRFPNYTSSGVILTEKLSFQQIRTYYLIDPSGSEQKLFKPGNVTPDHVNLVAANDLFAWAENTYHPRWELEDHTTIFTYNLQTGEKNKIAKKTKYYSPAPSYDHKYIAAIEFTPDGNQALVVLTNPEGSVEVTFDNPRFGQFAYPRFTRDNQNILIGYTDSRGNTIRMYNLKTQSFRNLLPFSDQIASRPVDYGEFVIYSSTYTGINNIYAVNKATGEILKITNSRFGAFEPDVSPRGNKLAYSDYTAMGFEIHEMLLNPESWNPFDTNHESNIAYYKPLDDLEGGDITSNTDSVSFIPVPYKPTFQGLFKFHSWTPFVAQNEFGVEFISNNIFNNTSATIGARYNLNDDSFITLGKLSYGALWPIIDGSYSYNIRNSKNIYDDTYTPTEYNWDEHNYSGGIRLPFKLSKGTYNSHLVLGAEYTYHSIIDIPTEPVPFSNQFGSVNSTLTFARFQTTTRQQIHSKWAQELSLSWDLADDASNAGEMLQTSVSFFFPGFYKTHSLFANGRYLKENLKTYRFEDRFEMARGFNDRLFQNKSDTEFDDIYVVSMNYELPVLFPDWDIWSLAYFRRISANIFYDYSVGTLNNSESMMRSAGLDLNFEITTLRLLLTSLTLRTLYRFDLPDSSMNPVYFNVVFNITDIAF